MNGPRRMMGLENSLSMRLPVGSLRATTQATRRMLSRQNVRPTLMLLGSAAYTCKSAAGSTKLGQPNQQPGIESTHSPTLPSWRQNSGRDRLPAHKECLWVNNGKNACSSSKDTCYSALDLPLVEPVYLAAVHWEARWFDRDHHLAILCVG